MSRMLKSKPKLYNILHDLAAYRRGVEQAAETSIHAGDGIHLTKAVATGPDGGLPKTQEPLCVTLGIKTADAAKGKLLKDFPEAESLPPGELLTTPCTVLVPAALERVITQENAANIRCRILAEAANGPTTPDADVLLAGSDIFVIPDVLCNAGGVTVSYFEWVQDLQGFFWDEDQVNGQLERLMKRAFQEVNDLAQRERIDRRTAAYMLAVKRVAEATKVRGLFP